MQDGSQNSANKWSAIQTYSFAAICFFIGIITGFLLHGPSSNPAARSERPTAVVAAQGPTAPSNMAANPTAVPSVEDMKRMADKAAEPLLLKLNSDPNNPALLNQLGILYRSAHQFKEARQYFARSLEKDPNNAGVRADMAACMYYEGDADGALSELQKSLKYDPKHPGALLNQGLIRWKAKGDTKGAISSWQTLLRLNPDFQQKEAVQRMISEAELSAKGRS